MSDYNPDSVNSIVLVSDFGSTKLTGPFDYHRDGSHWEVIINAEHFLTASIHEEDLQNYEGGTAVALADDEAIAHGEVHVVDYLADEERYIMSVDDPTYADVSDIPDDVDIEEVRG